MQRRDARTRGFTIIELMIVVAIIAVISLIAVVGYRRWIASARLAEATNMVGAIGHAQEDFKSQTGYYLDVSGGPLPPNMYPAATPGNFYTPWGGACASCKVPWRKLNVTADAPVLFGYATVADGEACDPSCHGVTLTLSAGAVNFPGLNGGAIQKPWYVTTATADTDGNGKFVLIVGHSFGHDLIVDNEGE